MAATDKVEPLSEPDEKESIAEDVNIPGEMLGETASLEDVTTNDSPSHDLSDSAKEAGLEDVAEIKGSAHDGQFEDITTKKTTDMPQTRALRPRGNAMKGKDT